MGNPIYPKDRFCPGEAHIMSFTHPLACIHQSTHGSGCFRPKIFTFKVSLDQYVISAESSNEALVNV